MQRVLRNSLHTTDEFGTRQAPLVGRIDKILSNYLPGSQILKVARIGDVIKLSLPSSSTFVLAPRS